MSDTAKWYVIHTYSGYEKNVARTIMRVVENKNLQDYVFDVIVPTETVSEKKDDKIKEHERNVLPGYVLVKMIFDDDNNAWSAVRNIRGVTGFVGASSQKPSPLSQKEVDAMGVETRSQTIDFAVGDSVEIADGPLAGFIGEVVEIDTDAMKVKVNVSMFGRETLSELDLLQVKPI